MKQLGNTFDLGSTLVPVFECDWCGARSIIEKRIHDCEVQHHHQEEFAAGIL